MLEISEDHQGGVNIVRLSGELMSVDASHFRQKLAEWTTGEGAKLVVDLSALRLLDSSGLSELIHAVTRARLTGGRVILVAPSPFVSGILSATRLDTWFEILPSIQDADREMSVS